MKIHRIYGAVLRYFYYFKHSLDRISDVFYWPVIDLLLFGLISLSFKYYNPQAVNIVPVVASGILFWIIVWRGQYEVTVNLLEELWNRNLINMFVSPLTFSEWTISVMLVGFIKALMGFAFASLIAFFLYQVKIFMFGFYLIPFIGLLILTGWWVGFLIAGLILRYGTTIQTFAWSAIMIISPFSAVYYPLAILPNWAKTISFFLPTSYMFEGIRQVIYEGRVDSYKLLMSLILNIIYLIGSLAFLKRSFDKALKRGLIKVY